MGLLGTMSAIGTALGPSLGGLLIAALSWRAIFLVTVPVGAVACLLIARHLPADQRVPETERAAFDRRGTALLAVTLASYTLAMTVGRGHFGSRNVALLAAAAVAAGLFALAQTRTRSPLIRPALLRSPLLSASLATSTLVSTVMMTTLVVGPFTHGRARPRRRIRRAGHDDRAAVAALTGVPAGRIADRLGAQRTITIGLGGIATGALALAALPASSASPATWPRWSSSPPATRSSRPPTTPT